MSLLLLLFAAYSVSKGLRKFAENRGMAYPTPTQRGIGKVLLRMMKK